MPATSRPSRRCSRSIRVRPLGDFTRLQTVLVVLYEPAQQLPSDELEGGLEFDRPDVDPTAPEETESETVDPFDPFVEEPTEGTEAPTDATTPPEGETEPTTAATG